MKLEGTTLKESLQNLKRKHLKTLFPIFLFSPNSSKHEFFSYLYMFSVSRNNLKIFFLVFYCVTVVSRSDRNLANQEQFRSVSYFAIIKHETVNPNVAIIKVWSKNVSIRVNRSRWIRTSFTNHYSFDIFANVLQPCWYHLIFSSNEYGFDSRVIN